MSLYQKASLVQIPSGYKASSANLYSVVPNSGDGDFTVSVDADATRVNKDGLIESVAANQARLNYDPTNPQDPHLLLEPTRTNSVVQSNDLSTTWVASSGVTLTANQSSPDGGTNAYKVEMTASGNRFLYITGGTTGVEYTISGYFRADTNTSIGFSDGNLSPNSIDLTTEWQRFTLTYTSGSSVLIQIDNYFGVSPTQEAKTFYAFGLQAEAGSYATSYIPTSGSAVTRTKDTAKIEPYTALPSDYPLTVFWEGEIDDYQVGQFVFSIFGTGSNAKYLGFSWSSANQIRLFRRSSTANDEDVVSFSSNQNTTYKVAVSFISNTEAKVYINGSLVYNLTSGLDVDYEFDSLLIGQQRVVSDSGFRNSAKQFMIFNEALTDAELITLTT